MIKPITFTADDREYNLQFKFPDLRIIQLIGDTSVGKSLLCSDFKKQQGIDKNLDNSIVIDIDSHMDLPTYLRSKEHNIVIIDNAEILITPEVDEIIRANVLSKKTTRWVIIGRPFYDCCVTFLCRGELQHTQRGEKDCISVLYEQTIGG